MTYRKIKLDADKFQAELQDRVLTLHVPIVNHNDEFRDALEKLIERSQLNDTMKHVVRDQIYEAVEEASVFQFIQEHMS